MATLTIRNVPDKLHTRLKEQAVRNRRSLNHEVIAELLSFDSVDERVRKQLRAEEMIAKVDGLRQGMKGFMTAEEIDAAIDFGQK